MADKSSKVSGTDEYAIYHEVSPNIVLLLRFFNFLVIVMIVLSFVFCLVQGHDGKQTFYLLACNTVISLFCGCVVNWWYRQGDLGPEKYWYIFLLGLVIIFQCVTTDMYVFHGPLPSDSSNIVPPTRISINGTTRFIPHTTRNHTTKLPFLYMTKNPFLRHWHINKYWMKWWIFYEDLLYKLTFLRDHWY